MAYEELTTAERFDLLLRRERRYAPEAYDFLYEALDWTLQHVVGGPPEPEKHVTGKELLEGIRQLALNKFGLLARAVFEQWGIHKTDDWGQIVFNLIDFDLLGRNESDSPEDFVDVYRFDEVFDLEPVIEYDEASGRFLVEYRRKRLEAEKERPKARH